jgi:hypothetical protein
MGTPRAAHPEPGSPASASWRPETMAPETMAPEVMAPEVMAPEVMVPEVMAPEVERMRACDAGRVVLAAPGRVFWTGGRGIAKSTANEGSPGIARRRGPRCGENERIPASVS